MSIESCNSKYLFVKKPKVNINLYEQIFLRIFFYKYYNAIKRQE